MRKWLKEEMEDTMEIGAGRWESFRDNLLDLGADSVTATKAAAIWAGSGIAEQSLRAVRAARPHARWAAQKVFNELTNTDFFNLDDGTVNNWREWIRDPDAPAAKKGGRR